MNHFSNTAKLALIPLAKRKVITSIIGVVLLLQLILHLKMSGLISSEVSTPSQIHPFRKTALKDVYTGPEYAPLMIGIVCDAESIWTLGVVAFETWLKDIEYDFRFFIGKDATHIPEALRPYTVQLSAQDGYPPREKVFQMWQTLHDDFGGYKWYMKVDVDAYINVQVLHLLVSDLIATNSTEGYLGKAGNGRNFERAQLGLNGPYCMGMGYLMGHFTLNQLRSELDWCFEHPHSQHSDTEIGNCNFQASRITCVDALMRSSEAQMFIDFSYNYEKSGLITSSEFKQHNDGQMVSNHDFFFGDPLGALLVHPLKSPESIRTLHNQVRRNLRPIIAPLWTSAAGSKPLYLRPGNKKSKGNAEKQALDFLDRACVHNPTVQEIETGLLIPECAPVPPSSFPSLSAISTFVVNLNHRRDRYDLMGKRFAKTGLMISRFEATNGHIMLAGMEMPDVVPINEGSKTRKMTIGEMGLRDTMRKLFEHALKTNIERLLILEDDVLPHNNFGEELLKILENDRCGGHLFSDKEGGTLQLGATIWSKGAWNVVDNDLAKARDALGEEPLCFNSYVSVSGAFAVIFHRNTFQEVVDWLNFGPTQPWDWVFGWLAKKGYITRAAYPFIVIPDITGESDVDNNRGPLQHDMMARASIHRWHQGSFKESKENEIKHEV